MTIARAVSSLLGELLAPSRCAACDDDVRAGALFCPSCDASVLPAGDQPAGQHAIFEYGGAVATAIVRFKYAGRFDLSSRFAAAMSTVHADVDLVVPVPLHPRRLIERGYDQAALIAAPVARRLGARFAPRTVLRIRETPPQASLDRAARAANVAAAFRCAPAGKTLVSGQRVLLVDDVRTTGATLAACAGALHEAGARDVLTLVLAGRGDKP